MPTKWTRSKFMHSSEVFPFPFLSSSSLPLLRWFQFNRGGLILTRRRNSVFKVLEIVFICMWFWTWRISQIPSLVGTRSRRLGSCHVVATRLFFFYFLELRVDGATHLMNYFCPSQFRSGTEQVQLQKQVNSGVTCSGSVLWTNTLGRGSKRVTALFFSPGRRGHGFRLKF